MATKARVWPNNAREQRDQAGEAAVRGMRALGPLVEGVLVDRTETVRRQAVALTELQRIAWLMASAGAPIRAEDVRA